MIESIRKAIVLPQPHLEVVAAVVTGAAFLWLLGQGLVQPIAIYLLELYLTF